MSKLVRDNLKNTYDSTLSEQSHCVVVDVQKLPSSKAMELRAHLRKSDMKMKVVLNRVARKSLEGTPIENAGSLLKGMTAIIYGGEDPVSVAKLLVDWRKEHKNQILDIKGGCIDGQVLDAKGVESVSKLPGKQELRGMLVSCIASPLTKILNVLQGPGRGVLFALNARQEKLKDSQ